MLARLCALLLLMGGEISAVESRESVTDVIERSYPMLAQGMPSRGFSTAFKNPCWHDERARRLRCLPYFNIVGVSKSGTTDLFERITLHPKVEKVRATSDPDGANNQRSFLFPFKGFFFPCPNQPTNQHMCYFHQGHKAPHFFDTSIGFQEYVSAFDVPACEFANGKPDHITGEASSATFTYPGIRDKCCSLNQERTPPKLLHWMVPGAKVLVLFRNPVQRFYAAFIYYGCTYGTPRNLTKVSRAELPRLFHEEAIRTMRLMQNCMHDEGKSAGECVAEHYWESLQLAKGMYSVFLGNWLSTVPSENLKVLTLILKSIHALSSCPINPPNQCIKQVILFEDYTLHRQRVLGEVIDFLGLPRPNGSEWETMNALRPKNRAGERSGGCGADRPRMWRRTARLLSSFYRPLDKDLAAKLNFSRPLWR